MLNTSLQQEVIMLRAEVQQLKSIILAHKDCPLLNQNKGMLDRLKDGWMDGWMGGWMDRWVGVWINESMDGWEDFGWINE